MTGARQCRARWNDIRCQLAGDHDSAHTARDAAGLLLSWSNPMVANARRISTAWVSGVHIPAGADHG